MIGGSTNMATYPSDFRTREVILTFLPNQFRQTASIEIVSDSVDEGQETFVLSLSLVSGAGQIHSPDNTAIVTIQDEPG